ncbi:helix-turn-helix transcriptional regulator [Streptomyces tsukubensis]|uniref:helix-turn-helix transcriptional regulator n=1 Tax=Streptomyces tsukubensis TaxID=83656 RepID=UPI0034500C04
MSPDELFTGPQIAKRLGVTRQAADQMIERGDLPAPVGHSGRTRFWPWILEAVISGQLGPVLNHLSPDHIYPVGNIPVGALDSWTAGPGRPGEP